MTANDTIFALSTAPGRAGIAIVRVSGPSAADALRALVSGMPVERRASRRRLRFEGDLIDDAVVLWFPGPGSVTGENVVEFHVHGAPAVTRRLLHVLGSHPGFRPAEPGEFTRRAFFAGRMDLMQVEGLDDLLAAETDLQRRHALRAVQGEHRAQLDDWRTRILDARALIEAMIDFSDEGDAPVETRTEVRESARVVAEEISVLLGSSGSAERLRDGVRVVIAGAPNAGKSSLFNTLLRRDAAIVAAEAGTTRDLLEGHIDLGGVPVILVDTAGLRETDSAVEREGIRRAWNAVGGADIVVQLVAPDAPETAPLPPGVPSIRLRTKVDLVDGERGPDGVSVVTGAGIDSFLQRLEAEARRVLFGDGEAAVMLRARQKSALEEARSALYQVAASADERGPELIAEDLRRAGDALGRLVGSIGVEDVLGAIFSRFCIGK
jgi:tRNA modification GTPase